MGEDTFQDTINSLGTYLVSNIGERALSRLSIRGDADSGTADVEISLFDQSWDAETRAIDIMIGARARFLEELSIVYHFVSPGSADMAPPHQAEARFELAGHGAR